MLNQRLNKKGNDLSARMKVNGSESTNIKSKNNKIFLRLARNQQRFLTARLSKIYEEIRRVKTIHELELVKLDM